MSSGHHRRAVRAYRSLMRLATRYPESEIAWENNRIPMSDDLRVEIRSAFRENMDEKDPEVVQKQLKEAERLKRMLEMTLQDGFFRMYPTLRPYHTWTGLTSSELNALKEVPKK
eukprot:TRINITY_DN13751_c0_g1_i2.p1 TRINITY_DN13751_c0_g1~~TRINITY_DN13751_c0_g1_i2.p1  ORF type:complete len:114 (+),score=30.80 TRINITY_DN13751_c0_g1_i2:76-417(+)